MTTHETWKARFGTTALVGTAALAVLVLADPLLHLVSVTSIAIDDATAKAAIFSALLAVSGLFLTVLLAMLGIVTSMDDDKPVVRIMKQHMRNYEELIHRLVGPVFSLLLLAAVSLGCLLVPSIAVDKLDAEHLKIAQASRQWWTLLPSFGFSLTLGLFAQTAMTARLLAKVLLFKPRTHSPSDTPEAAVERMRVRREAAIADRAPSSPPIALASP